MASYKTVFNRKNKLNKDGKALVQIEVYQKGRRSYFSTGVLVSPEQWNSKKQEVKSDSVANQRIRLKRKLLEEFELAQIQRYGSFRLADFDKMKQADTKRKDDPTFTDYFYSQLLLDKSGIGKEWHDRKILVHNRLLEWHGKPVEFAELDYALIVGFDQALRNRYKLDTGTIHKEHQILNRYIERALKSKLLSDDVNPYEQFQAKRKESDKSILAEQEVAVLEQLVLPARRRRLQFHLDAWLLCYYTTLRIGDLTTLRPRHLIETKKGLLLEKQMEKTDRTVYIPLWNLHQNEAGDSKAALLLRKYWSQSDQPFFRLSHYHLNKGFKRVLELAGITKHITFHSARHTGITHLVKKLPVPIVQRIAGHSKIQTTMQYMHLSNQDVEQALDQVNWQ